MRLKAYSVLFLVLILGCDPGKYGENNLLSYVPDDASIIIKINNLSTFQSELRNNGFLNDAGNAESVKRIKSTFKIINEIQADTTSLIALYEGDTTHLLYVGTVRSNWFRFTDTTDFNTSFKEGIQNIEIGGLKLYAGIQGGNRIASTSEDLLKRALNYKGKRNSEDLLTRLYRTTSPPKIRVHLYKHRHPINSFPKYSGK